MGEQLFAAETRTAGSSFKVGCLGGVALVAGVVAVVSLFFVASGESMTPSLATAINFIIPIGLVIGVALGFWAYRIHRETARRLTIRRAGEELAVEISPDLSFRGDLRVDFGWQAGMQHGAARTKLLWCDIHREDEFLLRLTHEIGGLHSVPGGWPKKSVTMDRPSTHGGYTLGKLPELVQAMLSANAADP